jgi:hypothetical protein
MKAWLFGMKAFFEAENGDVYIVKLPPGWMRWFR